MRPPPMSVAIDMRAPPMSVGLEIVSWRTPRADDSNSGRVVERVVVVPVVVVVLSLGKNTITQLVFKILDDDVRQFI